MSGVSAPSLLLSRTLNRDLLSSRSLVGLPLASPHLQQYRFSTHKYITQIFHLHLFTFNNTDSVHSNISHRSSTYIPPPSTIQIQYTQIYHTDLPLTSLHLQQYRFSTLKYITQIFHFSICKLAVQSKLGTQSLAQLKYSNVHQL